MSPPSDDGGRVRQWLLLDEEVLVELVEGFDRSQVVPGLLSVFEGGGLEQIEPVEGNLPRGEHDAQRVDRGLVGPVHVVADLDQIRSLEPPSETDQDASDRDVLDVGPTMLLHVVVELGVRVRWFDVIDVRRTTNEGVYQGRMGREVGEVGIFVQRARAEVVYEDVVLEPPAERPAACAVDLVPIALAGVALGPEVARPAFILPFFECEHGYSPEKGTGSFLY